jgi:hypothetical protein
MATGSSNSFFGGASCGANSGTAANYNTGLGSGSQGGLIVGSYSYQGNTSIGNNSLAYVQGDNASENTCCGGDSLISLTTGRRNSFLGYSAGSTIATGQYNTGCGYNAFSTASTDSNYCTFLGANTNLTVGSLTGTTCIGAGTTCGTSSTIQLGSNGEVVAISGNLKSGSNTIGANQLGYLAGVSTGIVDTATGQTIGGAKSFSTPPTMSGANISSTSIPDGALSSNVALLTGTQTFSGAKSFSVAPTMSGANISSTTIPDGALSSNFDWK